MDSSSPDQDSKFSPEETAACCEGPLHQAAVEGLRLFNAGEYFEAHEALETAWRDETGPIRNLYRGILQVGVAYHHIQRGNYRGARKLFLRCRQWLDPFPDECRGIQVGKLRRDARRVEDVVIRLGPEGIAHVPESLFQPVEYSLSSEA